MIDTRSIHEQLLDQCQQDLSAGKWRTGKRFPSERELAAQHGISRATANKVLAKLISEGWLEHQRGIGCFVAERPTLFASLQHLESFTAFARKLGGNAVTRVRSLQKLPQPSTELTQALQLEKGESVWQLERLRELDGELVIFERRWLPCRLYPELKKNMLSGSFYELCRNHYQLTVAGEDLRISAETPTLPETSNWQSPAFVFRGTGSDTSGQPLWLQEITYRGEVFELRSASSPTLSYPEFSLVYKG